MFKNLSAANIGLITGSVMIVLSIIFFYVLKLPASGTHEYAIFLVYTAGIIWSLLNFKNSPGDDKKFKTYFTNSFRTFVVVTLLMVIFTFVYFKFDTSFRDAGIATNNALLLKEGNHTPEEIAENAKQLEKIFMPVMLGITTFKYLILGALITVVGAGFLSQRRQ